MGTYVAHYTPGPNWVAGQPLREQPLKPHVEYLLGLHREERLLMGGPLADGSGGLVIFSAPSAAEVDVMLSGDPAIKSGILVADVKEWSRIA